MWMDPKNIMLSEVSQRKTNTVYHLYVDSKNNANESTYKTETDSQTENKLMVTKGERGEWGKLGVWD